MYGICAEQAWSIHGLNMEPVWRVQQTSNMHKIWMEYAGVCMGCAWGMYGLCTDQAWHMTLYEIGTEQASNVHGISMA